MGPHRLCQQGAKGAGFILSFSFISEIHTEFLSMYHILKSFQGFLNFSCLYFPQRSKVLLIGPYTGYSKEQETFQLFC